MADISSNDLPWRCDVTKHIVGTDTYMMGYQCPCQACRAVMVMNRLRDEIEWLRSVLQVMERLADERTAEIERLLGANVHLVTEANRWKEYAEKMRYGTPRTQNN